VRRFKKLAGAGFIALLSHAKWALDQFSTAQTLREIPVVKWIFHPWFSPIAFSGAVVLFAWGYYDLRTRKEQAGFAVRPESKSTYRKQAILGAILCLFLFVAVPLLYGHYHRPKQNQQLPVSTPPIALKVEPQQPSTPPTTTNKPIKKTTTKEKPVKKPKAMQKPKAVPPVPSLVPQSSSNMNDTQAIQHPEVVQQCPADSIVIRANNFTSQDNGECGIAISGNKPVCIIATGKLLLQRNLKDGMCIISNGDAIPDPKQQTKPKTP
jgi:hypothetical protein